MRLPARGRFFGKRHRLKRKGGMAEVVLRESCLASRKKPLVGLLRE